MKELLQERSGFVPSVTRIASRIVSSVNVEQIRTRGYQTIKFKGLWIGDDCRVYIRVGKSDGIQGEAILANAEVDSETKKIHNVPINLFLESNLRIDQEHLRTVLEHELTHMYEFLQRSIRAEKLQDGPTTSYKLAKLNKNLDSATKTEVLSQINAEARAAEGYRKKLLTFLSGCFYIILPLEQNAFIAQMRSELQSKAGELKNYRKAAEIVEHTQAWQNLRAVKSYMVQIKKLQKEHNKALVVKWCSAFFGDAINNYTKAVKRLEYELDRFERKLKNRLGKMCGELYQNSEEFLKEWRHSWNFSRPSLEEVSDSLEEDV